MRGATVTLARLDPEPVVSFGVKPDDRGHYQLDSVPAGRYDGVNDAGLFICLHVALSDEPAEVRAFAAAGADALITDVPDIALSVLGRAR